MTEIPPLAFRWNGDVLEPLAPKLCDKHYVVGEIYRLVPHEERSIASHRFYFASIAEAHRNLPEDMAERFPSPDHLRRWALIKSGHRDERSFVCASKAEAQRMAAFMKPMDEFAVILVNESTVTVFTAKSQSKRAMGRATFEASKESVLRVLAEMIGTDPATLKNAARAA